MRFCFVVLMLTWAGAAHAATFSDSLPRFERQGDGFVCHAAAAAAGPVQPCLKIGPVAVGLSRGKLESQWGRPAQSLKQDGHELFLYDLEKESSGYVTTYLQVTYAPDQTVDSIQLAGQPRSDSWNFCGLKLGDTMDTVRARLGEPLGIDAGQAGSETLRYSPYFTIALHEKRISAIRVAAAGPAPEPPVASSATVPGFTVRIGP